MLRVISLMMTGMLALVVSSCGGDATSETQDGTPSTKAQAQTATYVMMPESTAIAVTLVDSIDTDVHISGTEFRAKLSEPIVVDGHTLFPYGAEAKGELNKVVESGRLTTPAELNFSLTAIQDAGGRWVDVETDTIMEKKASHTDREVAMIGGGAIVGGIIGKVVNKKGSTEIGAVAGAAAGTGLSAATGKRDIFYGAGSEIVFFTSNPMKITLR
ncbi:hypothetical protein KQH82_03975 [bacterium]|nr:hypothetical protein [bacterium]